jgi:hypothetical protein
MSKLDDAITNSYDHESTTDGPWEIDEDKLKRNVKALMLDLARAEYHYQDSADELLAKIVKKVEEL